jgi:hypothetical protein
MIQGLIFKLREPKERVLAANHASIDELCNEKRFQKAVTGLWLEVGHAVGMAVGPLSVQAMFP